MARIKGTDKPDAIDADTTRSGNQAFTEVEQFTGHAGELRVLWFLDQTTSDGAQNRWIVSGDVNGDGYQGFTIHVFPADLLTLEQFGAADFVL